MLISLTHSNFYFNYLHACINRYDGCDEHLIVRSSGSLFYESTCTSLGVSLYLSSNTTLQIRCFCCKNSEIYRHWNLPQGTRKSVAFMRDRFLFQPRGNHMMKDASSMNSVIPRPVRGAAYCTQCRRLLNRDENAAMNIAYVLVKYVRHGVLRPPHLSRN